MKHEARIQSTIELLEHVYDTWQKEQHAPVDAIIAKYFKTRRYIGSKDRGAISDLLYFVLRHGATLEWHVEKAGQSITPRRAVIAALLFYGEKPFSRSDIVEIFCGKKFAPAMLEGADHAILDTLEGKELFDPAMPAPVRYNFPDWMEERLHNAFGKTFGEAMEALNQQAPIDLRANLLKCKDRGDLILALDRDGIFATATPLSPVGVRLKKRVAVFNSQAFKEGLYEVQDEGSQLVSLLVNAKAGQKVIDFCAGAGGKTLAIAATMHNKGRILAWDTSAVRLKQMGKRLARAGVSNVQTHVLKSEADPFLKRHISSADWVLVDAPCSGSGTWRRNPDLKWRCNIMDFNKINMLQQNILTNAARLVRSGGRLVYVTCSIFPEENELQVKEFLGKNPTFRVERPYKLWNKHVRDLPGVGPCIALNPHQDGTDGFFAAVLINN